MRQQSILNTTSSCRRDTMNSTPSCLSSTILLLRLSFSSQSRNFYITKHACTHHRGSTLRRSQGKATRPARGSTRTGTRRRGQSSEAARQGLGWHCCNLGTSCIVLMNVVLVAGLRKDKSGARHRAVGSVSAHARAWLHRKLCRLGLFETELAISLRHSSLASRARGRRSQPRRIALVVVL